MLQNVYGLVDFSDDDGCYITTGLSNVNNIKNKIIAVSDSYSRCTISKKVMLAQKIGAGGILIVLSIKVGTLKVVWKWCLHVQFLDLLESWINQWANEPIELI